MLLAMLADGRLHRTAMAKLAPHLTTYATGGSPDLGADGSGERM